MKQLGLLINNITTPTETQFRNLKPHLSLLETSAANHLLLHLVLIHFPFYTSIFPVLTPNKEKSFTNK